MDEQKKYEVIKGFADHPDAGKERVALTLGHKITIQTNLVAVGDAHSRRPRAAYFGELLQMDATSYEWIYGVIWHLHLAIDGAAGR